MDRLDRILTRIESCVILSSYATLIFLVGVETVRRLVTGSQFVWGPEVALYAFIWLSWFSMGEHIRNHTNLAFDGIRERLGHKSKLVLELIDCVLWILIGSVVIYGSVGVVANNIDMERVVFGTSIPLAAAAIAVPLGWGFSMLRIAQRIYVLLHGAGIPVRSEANSDAVKLNAELGR